ncbi:hypothetical protein [Microbacterium sp. 5K110]|uniref:hypothetical protein n=1 Tax=unclassified Microbacterium TaxID=2609290 RepID=UPI0010FED7D6|nr:hypothetical protein [Microbacterium sp. 5K110]TLF28364.1 hypothetical protein FE256_14365 [Microbacterium sp. 5K110]
MSSVHLTIESIARGKARPRKLILWLDSEADLDAAVKSPGLARLRRRGLEIRRSEPMGPHGKYYPYVASEYGHALPLATADDDILYPRSWLVGLVAAQTQDPSSIHCYRAHRIGLIGNKMAPYMSWVPVKGTAPSHRNFLTGVSGVIYPTEYLDFLHQKGEAFRAVAPKADDVWLNACAVEAGFRVSQIRENALFFSVIPGSQRVALWRHNVGGNDPQIDRAYTPPILSAVLEDGREK